MRIIAGDWRGRALSAVGKGDPGAHLRPTTDRVRESLFNMLGGGRFGDPFDGTRVLDLFAGSGALGAEALSRGAGQALLVEKKREGDSKEKRRTLFWVAPSLDYMVVKARHIESTLLKAELIMIDYAGPDQVSG